MVNTKYEKNDLDKLAEEARRRGFDDWRQWVLWACPLGDWPARDIVDLDNLGDPGNWLQNNLSFEEVFSNPTEIEMEEISEGLASQYIVTHEKYWGESYSDYYDTDDSYQEFFAGIVNEFMGFIQEWQKRVWLSVAESMRV